MRILKLVKLENIVKKNCKFVAKNVLFGYFQDRFLKNYCHIRNMHIQICQLVKFGKKSKMLKFGTKIALFGYFRARILESYIYILNQHPQICLIAKFILEIYIGLIVILEISTLKYV